MKSREKNSYWNEQPSALPSGIGSVKTILQILFCVWGFCVWGTEFLWVVLGFVFCYDIIRGLFSCLISLVALVGFFYFLFTHII